MLISRQTGEVELDNTGLRLILTAEAWTHIEAGTGLGTMELAEKAHEGRLSMTQLVHFIIAGNEAWRRRTKASGQTLNPTKALKAIEATGGMLKTLAQIAEAIRFSQALGIYDGDEAEEDEPEDPTTGSDSSDDASLPASLRSTPGS